MNYNFDKLTNRISSNSIKWNNELQGDTFSKNTNLIPLWIADMDFEISPEIKNRLEALVKHAIFGYAGLDNEYFISIINWQKKVHNWDIKKEEIIYTPGIVPAISYLIEAFSEKGDSIMIFPPVYYPFKTCIVSSKRNLIECPLLKNESNYYTLNFLEIENMIIKNNIRIIIFCSPHNPVGRVWKKEELEKLINICLKYNVLIFSDEIHSDLVFSPNKHIPLLSLNNEASKISIVCNAVTKTFNLAGLPISNIIIKNKDLKEKYYKVLERYGVVFPNVFSVEAAKAAYNSYEWYSEVLVYIEKNIEFADTFIKKYLPYVKFKKPEGTYLGWIDFSYYNFNEHEFKIIFEKHIGIAIDYGFWFGNEGKGFIRLNFACSKILLESVLLKIKDYFDTLN